MAGALATSVGRASSGRRSTPNNPSRNESSPGQIDNSSSATCGVVLHTLLNFPPQSCDIAPHASHGLCGEKLLKVRRRIWRPNTAWSVKPVYSRDLVLDHVRGWTQSVSDLPLSFVCKRKSDAVRLEVRL